MTLSFTCTAESVCEDNAIADVNNGSPFFLCPLADDADDAIRCCGVPGEQVCCTEEEAFLDTSVFGDVGKENYNTFNNLFQH